MAEPPFQFISNRKNSTVNSFLSKLPTQSTLGLKSEYLDTMAVQNHSHFWPLNMISRCYKTNWTCADSYKLNNTLKDFPITKILKKPDETVLDNFLCFEWVKHEFSFLSGGGNLGPWDRRLITWPPLIFLIPEEKNFLEVLVDANFVYFLPISFYLSCWYFGGTNMKKKSK